MDGRKTLIGVGCHSVRGLKINTAYTHSCIDIFAISEHWLHSFELNQLAVFHPEFSFYAASHPSERSLFTSKVVMRELAVTGVATSNGVPLVGGAWELGG